MEIIEAVWDDVNLGVKTFEIVLARDDSVAAFVREEQELIERRGARYLVVKTPVNVAEFLFDLPRLGYTLIETAFSLQLRKENYTFPPFLTRFDGTVAVKPAGKDGVERVFAEIARGMFNTDRIALDRNFSQATANRRYTNWIGSVLERDGRLEEVHLRDEPIGFFVLQPRAAGTMHGILTGLYDKYRTSGYGTLVMKKLADTVWDGGSRIYTAQVVSNNPQALRANLLFGSEIKNVTYSFVKSV